MALFERQKAAQLLLTVEAQALEDEPLTAESAKLAQRLLYAHAEVGKTAELLAGAMQGYRAANN
jgi:hypothetical protein